MQTVLVGSVAGNAMLLLNQYRRKPVDIAQSRVNRLAASGHINWLVRDAGWEYVCLWCAGKSGRQTIARLMKGFPVHASPAVHADTASQLAVRTDRLTKRFGDVVAVDDLTLVVTAGEVFGFLGPNGAGKSTTLRLILGLIRPSAGRAQIFGVDARDVTRAHKLLAYLPADVALWPALTGAEILELLGNVGPNVDVDYRAELVERFQLDLERPAKAYSSGNRQKVALVATFATRAPLLVLDEPTSGLDPLMDNEFRKCVLEAKERGQTVFLSSHQLAEVEALCDRVAILRAGRLVDIDSIADLRLMRRTVVEVCFRGARPVLDNVPEVSNIDHLDSNRVRFNLAGAPSSALRALAQAAVTALAMREPTLEEIFLDYYGESVR